MIKHLQVILFGLLIFGPLHAAAEEAVTPFIKSEYFMQNISLDDFRINPREYFRSEAAFNLLVGYVESEINQPLTNAEFIALMKDASQARARSCPTTEKIRVGGLSGNHFYWFTRFCREGEEMVQLRLNDRWIDVFSLNCLNAKEDTTPVPAPLLAAVLVPVVKTADRPAALAEPIRKQQFSDVVYSGVNSFGQGVIGGNYCNGLFFVPGGQFQMNDTIQSSGYSRTGEHYDDY